MTQGWGTWGKPRGLSKILYHAHEPLASEQQTYFWSSLLSFRLRRERSDDPKCFCCSLRYLQERRISLPLLTTNKIRGRIETLEPGINSCFSCSSLFHFVFSAFYKSRAARKSTCHWSVVCFMCFLTGDRCFVLAAA